MKKTQFKTLVVSTAAVLAFSNANAATDTTTIGVHTTVVPSCVLHDDNTSTTYTTRVVDFGDYDQVNGNSTYSTTATDDYSTAYLGGNMTGEVMPTNDGGGVLPAVVVSCSLGLGYTLTIDSGKQGSGSGASIARNMASEESSTVTSDTINYTLACGAVDLSGLATPLGVLTALGISAPFDVTGCSGNWGDDAASDFAGTGLGESVNFPAPLVAAIPAGQGEKLPGAYGDIVTVTLTF